MPRADGPVKILEKVNDNAYKLELPGEMGVSPTLNVGDLTAYLEDKDDGDGFRENHNQEGEDEVIVLPTQVQESSHILLNAHRLHQKALSPCIDSKIQFQPHPKPFRCATLSIWEGQEASSGVYASNGVTPSARIKEGQNSGLRFLS